MSAPARFNRHGLVVVPADADQTIEYTTIYCLTAGNLVVRLISAATGLVTADITIPMTAGQTIELTPRQIRATGTTGTYLGLIAS